VNQSVTRALSGEFGTPRTGQSRCLVMGIVNVTPDSFSDGGRWLDTDAAVRHGLELVEQGADVVDVGGESTRPGARRPTPEVELRRVLPVVDGLVRAGVYVAVDTMRASVAEATLDVGAAMINDVSGGLADPELVQVVAGAGVPYVVMHWRAHARAMNEFAHYHDVVAEVTEHLKRRCAAVTEAGVSPERIVVDPGLGFAKNAEQSWQLVAHFEQLMTLDAVDGETSARDDATAALTSLAAAAGAWCVRVHRPRASADAVRVVARVNQSRVHHP
jgi:dihydropteroate synthase